MIKENDKIGASAATNLYIDKVEKVDDYTVKFTMKESFRALHSVTASPYGAPITASFLSTFTPQQADVTTFKDEQPVVAGTVHRRRL